MESELLKRELSKGSWFSQDFVWLITTGTLLFGYFYTRIKNDIKLLEYKTKNNETSCKDLKYNVNRLSLKLDSLVDKKDITNIHNEIENASKNLYSIEINKNKYQAWSGTVKENDIEITILITKYKFTSNLSNNEWISWNEEKNGSTIARDFYLGSFQPEFEWCITHGEPCEGITVQNMTNGWDNIVTVKINITMKSWESSKQFTTNTVSFSEAEEEQKIFNTILKEFHRRDSSHPNPICWKRILVDASS